MSGSNDGYTMFRGSVKSTGYTLHSSFSPSLPLPCVTVCHHISTGLYNIWVVPEVVSGHVVYVLVHHVQTDGLRMTVALDGPGLLVPVVALRHNRRG